MTAPDEIGARLSLRDRAQFIRDAEAAADSVASIGQGAERAEQKSRGPLSRIGSGIMGVGKTALRAGAWMATGLAAGGAAAVGLGISTAAGMETAEIGFTTMLGSAEKAQAFLGDLNTFAAKTPFDLPGLQRSASSLVSAGIEADKVIPIMTSLGNATSGMGTGAEGIQRATVALQQMNAAGKITGEDLNQLRDAGIPVFDLLAAATGKSVKQVAELAHKGKLGAKELEQLMGALESGKGLERFNGLMEAQSATMSGLWSTLKDTFSVGMADAIQPLVPMIKDGLGGAIAFTAASMPKLKAGIADVALGAQWVSDILFKGDFTGKNPWGLEEDSKVVDFLFDVRETAIGVYDILYNGDFSGPFLGFEEDSRMVDFLFDVRESVLAVMDTIKTGDTSGLGGIADSFAQVGDDLVTLAPAATAFGAALPDVATSLGLVTAGLSFAAENVDTLIKFMPLIVAGFVAFKAAQAAANLVSAVSVPLRIAEVMANRALVKELRAVAVSQATATAATGINTAATATNTTATRAGVLARVRMRAVSIATAAATGIMTAAQWLLNTAMLANPLGLVIIGLVALGAALFIAWKKSETFRNIVTGAWNAIKVAAGAAVDWIIGKWRSVSTFFSNLKMPTVNWGGIKDGFKSSINWVIGKWNDLSFGIPEFDTKIPGLGKVGGFRINTPNIPRLHSGGSTTTGGLVNMRPGEEIVVLPPAASVIPLPDEVRADPPGMTNQDVGPRIVQVILDGRVLAETVLDDMQTKAARR